MPPAKTTSKAPRFLNEFDGGGSSLLIKTAALLLGGDGTPVVAEAKVTTKPKSYDTDTFLTLVQALANACLFATADLTRGRDIEAVCGQLAAAPRDRLAAAT